MLREQRIGRVGLLIMLLLVVVPVAVVRVLADEPGPLAASSGGPDAGGPVLALRAPAPAYFLPGGACGAGARLVHGGGLNRSLEDELP
jgi:hypothetical protein